MGWWPFKRESNNSGNNSGGGGGGGAPLDADLQQYYDDVVAQGQRQQIQQQEQEQAAGKVDRTPLPSNNTRIRATTDTLNTQKTLKQIAMDNCVEFEKAYSTCLVKGTYFERFSGCPTQLTTYEQCQNMQQEALAVLGFARAQSDAQRRAVKAQADDLMIKTVPSLTISAAEAEAFTAALRESAPN